MTAITGALADLIERITGLDLARGGMSTAVERFVSERMRALRLSRIENYAMIAADLRGGEQRKLIEAITVPHTGFYRDPDQLQTIALIMGAAPPGRVRVWVAGCATGEEAYTLAMIGRRIGREVSIHATDINETALAAALRGAYSEPDVPVPERRWFTQRDNLFFIDDVLRKGVSFARHNLMDAPPDGPRDGWDLIVCRNVLIYFAPAAARRVLNRFARAVREGGSVVLGASEVVIEPPEGLELVSSGNRLVLRRGIRPPFRPVVLTPPVPEPVREPVREPPPEPRTDNLAVALNRGHALFDRGDAGGAIPIYSELTARHPSVAEPWLFLGIAQFTHGDLAAASSALRACLCLDATLWPAGFYLARTFDGLGQRGDALQQYEQLANGDPQPLALRSTSALINELRALQHDVRAAARRMIWPRWPLK